MRRLTSLNKLLLTIQTMQPLGTLWDMLATASVISPRRKKRSGKLLLRIPRLIRVRISKVNQNFPSLRDWPPAQQPGVMGIHGITEETEFTETYLRFV